MSWSKTSSFCTRIKIAFTYVCNSLRLSHFQSCIWITKAPNGWTVQESRDLHSKIKCQIWNSITNIIIILLMGGNLQTWSHTKLCQFFNKNPSLSIARYRSFENLEKRQTKAFLLPDRHIGVETSWILWQNKGPSIQKDLVEALVHSKGSFPNYNSNDFCVCAKKYSLSKFPNYNSHDFCVQKYSLSEWLDKCRPHSFMASRGPRTLTWNFFSNLIDK
jgi:hypothetical protein